MPANVNVLGLKTECPTCGVQTLRPAAFHLTIMSAGAGHFYTFFCPCCTEEIRTPCTERIVCIMLDVGVANHEVKVPAEIAEHPPLDAPPISPDDVMDFVSALRSYGGDEGAEAWVG